MRRVENRRLLALIVAVALLALGVTTWVVGGNQSHVNSTTTPGAGGVAVNGHTSTPLAPTGPLPVSTPEESVTVSFAVWEEERAVYAPLKDAFEVQHPGIHIHVVSLEDVVKTQVRVNGGQRIEVQDL